MEFNAPKINAGVFFLDGVSSWKPKCETLIFPVSSSVIRPCKSLHVADSLAASDEGRSRNGSSVGHTAQMALTDTDDISDKPRGRCGCC